MMVFMLFKNPLQALMQTNAVFTKYETPRTRGKMWVVKAVYVLMNLVALGLGIWKVNGMGLLPYVDSFLAVWMPTITSGLTLSLQNNEIRLACLGKPTRTRRTRRIRLLTIHRLSTIGVFPSASLRGLQASLWIETCDARDTLCPDRITVHSNIAENPNS